MEEKKQTTIRVQYPNGKYDYVLIVIAKRMQAENKIILAYPDYGKEEKKNEIYIIQKSR